MTQAGKRLTSGWLVQAHVDKKIIFTCSWDYNQWRVWDCHFQFTNSFHQWWDPVASLPGWNCALKFSSHQTCNVAISAELYVLHVVTICFPPALCVSRQHNYSETPQKRNPLCIFEVGKTKHLLDWLATCLVEFRVQLQKRKQSVDSIAKGSVPKEWKVDILNGKHVMRSQLLNSALFCAHKVWSIERNVARHDSFNNFTPQFGLAVLLKKFICEMGMLSCAGRSIERFIRELDQTMPRHELLLWSCTTNFLPCICGFGLGHILVRAMGSRKATIFLANTHHLAGTYLCTSGSRCYKYVWTQ